MKSKTLQIFDTFFSGYGIIQEQTPDGEDVSMKLNPEPQTSIDENEKYIIKILTNAFIFNPDLFDKPKQRYIFSKIDQIKGMVNTPVSKIVNKIKKIISIDRSLKVESKTLSLLNKYLVLVEQPADATEPQNNTQESKEPSNQSKEQNLNGESNKLNLAEIFPLYKELILKALKHVPTEEELMIVKPVVNEFADSDPEKIVETIQNILSQSLEDKEVEDNLSNV